MDSNKRLGLLPQGRMALILFGAIILLSFTPILTVFAPSSLAKAQADFTVPQNEQSPIIQTFLIQENSFLASTSHFPPPSSFTIIETIPVTVTAYSSTVWETDDTPFITAANTQTRDGIVASNLLPFGTKIRIPEYFGSKIFLVEDRMNERIGDFTIDIWFPSAWQARQFGVKYTYIETIR
ncbi:MAG: 3D domain-containing protein [bacterium]|nr:3D domain-containing protein [bacterium]